jgi:L-ribulokinase
MGQGFEKEYKPIAENAKKYKKLYETYTKLSVFVEKEIAG